MRVVAGIVLSGLLVAAPHASAGASSSSASAAAHPCGRIGLSSSQEALVQQRARASLPADIRRLATTGEFYFCIAIPNQGRPFAVAFHVPIANVGSREASRWVYRVASASVAQDGTAAIRANPTRFLQTIGDTDPTTHVTGVRSLHAFLIVNISQIRRG